MNRSYVKYFAAGALAVGAACSTPPSEAPAATVREVPAAGATAPAPSPLPGATARETLEIHPRSSSIAFTGAKVSASHEGGFREFTGTVELDPARVENSTIAIEIRTASIFADSDRLTGHLKSPDFFDVERFPTATFRSTAIRAGGDGNATHTITGTLTMHGVTREVTFPATVTLSADRLRADASFSIDRHDWGLTYPGAPDDLIRDAVDLRLRLDLPRAPRS